MTVVFCCNCNCEVNTNLITGKIVYPHRKDLYKLKFLQCPTCNHFVGTHKGSNIPLGSIPTPKLKAQRSNIHSIMDPLWRNKLISRTALYNYLTSVLGRTYHTAELRNDAEVNKILYAVNYLKNKLSENHTV